MRRHGWERGFICDRAGREHDTLRPNDIISTRWLHVSQGIFWRYFWVIGGSSYIWPWPQPPMSSHTSVHLWWYMNVECKQKLGDLLLLFLPQPVHLPALTHGSPDSRFWSRWFETEQKYIHTIKIKYKIGKKKKKIKKFTRFNHSKVRRSVLDKPRWRPRPPSPADMNTEQRTGTFYRVDITTLPLMGFVCFTVPDLPLLEFGCLRFAVLQTETLECWLGRPGRNTLIRKTGLWC